MMYTIFFFFNDTATTEIYTLSLTRRSSDLADRGGPPHRRRRPHRRGWRGRRPGHHDDGHATQAPRRPLRDAGGRSEEHTSELQSRLHLVWRLLLEKKKSDPHNVSNSSRHNN